MKKSVAIILLCVSLLLIVSGVWLGMTQGWTRPASGTLSSVGEFDAAGVGSIRIESQSVDVRIYDGSGRTVVVDASGDAAGLFSAELRGDTLYVTQERSVTTVFRLFDRKDPDMHIVLWLPSDYAGTVAAKTSSGDITVSNLQGGPTLELTASSGNIDVYDCRAAAISCAASSGDVYLDGNETDGNMDVVTSSGDVSLRGLACAGLNVETNSGDVWGSGLTADRVEVNTNSGEAALVGVDAPAVEIETSSGDVELSKAAPDSLDVKTSSGEVELELTGREEDYAVDYITNSGDFKGSRGGRGSKIVTIRTSSGDAEVEFKE